MSQLKVNSIIPVGGVPSGGGGGIVQIVQTFKNDATSTSSATFGDISGMSATITPTSTSSKILVRFSLCISSTTGTLTHFNLLRGSTNIAEPSTSVNNASTIQTYTNSPKIVQQDYEFLDSPSTTSATTYKLQWRSHASSAVSSLNQYFDNTAYVGTSTMTLMEVSA